MGYVDKFDELGDIDLEAIHVKVMENPGMQQQIIDYNQYQLEELGVDHTGQGTGDYSPTTIQYKIAQGQRTDHITLLDKGDFFNSMAVIVKGVGGVITGDMQKPDKNLEDQWPDALGLTDESIEAIRGLYNELFLEEYKRRVNKILNG